MGRKIAADNALEELDGRPPLDLATLGAIDRVVAPVVRTRFETTYFAGLLKAESCSIRGRDMLRNRQLKS